MVGKARFGGDGKATSVGARAGYISSPWRHWGLARRIQPGGKVCVVVYAGPCEAGDGIAGCLTTTDHSRARGVSCGRAGTHELAEVMAR